MHVRGVSWYVGSPGTGKTHAARAHAIALKKERRVPILVIDSTGGLDGLPTCTVDRVPEVLWGRRRSSVRVVPQTAADVDRLSAQVYAGKDAIVIVDEAGWWLGSHSRGGALLKLLRAWRHARADVLLTTQALSGDVPQSAIACATAVFAFRQTSPASIERLRQLGLSAELPDRPRRFCRLVL